MPTWGQLLTELQQSASTKLPIGDLDSLRRKYMQQLHGLTGRNLIVYATAWTQQKPGVAPNLLSITAEDIQALMVAVHGLSGGALDLLIHSPGGDLATTEAIVTYLRSRFDDVRIIVPGMAMSAACMIACSADRLVMGAHSFLGPIDPQLTINTATGPRPCAAHAILEQFRMAREECKDQSKLAAWLPMLSQYGPDLLIACQNAISLSESLSKTWLQTHMLKADPCAEKKADDLSRWLSNHTEMMTHGRFLSREVLKTHGMLIDDLESDQAFQDAVLSVFHILTHVFSMSTVTKIVENHEGKSFLKIQAPNISPNLPFKIGP